MGVMFSASASLANHSGAHSQRYVPGVWVDPHGCDHWIIDDSAEGYLSQRLDRYGKPVCSGVGVPNATVGKSKNWVPDPI